MPYVRSDGAVVDKRTWFRLSIFSDAAWGIIDTFGLFFSTLFNPTAPVNTRMNRNRTGGSRGGASSSGGPPPPRFQGGANIRTLPKPCASSGG